ncbi:MAG TPA: O-antigen polymerase [Longimicrobium sp.]|nr:O-antigen polymerase [Longimicrobium sp.]
MHHALAAPAAAPPEHNPFVPIAWPWRVGILAFVLLYRVLLPGAQQILYPGSAPLGAERMALDVVYEVALFAPLFFYRREWGWLHPLLFPALFSVAKAVLSGPGQLLAPLGLFYAPPDVPLFHVALEQWSQHDIAMAMIKSRLIMLLGLTAYYVGFFLAPRPRVPVVEYLRARAAAPKALAVVGFSLVLFAVFMRMRGGIGAHLASFGLGRFRAVAGLGHFSVLILTGTTAALIWFAVDATTTRKPLFWATAALVIPISFLLSGSRSSVIDAAVLFVVVWMIRTQKVPAARGVLLGMTAIFLVGALGALRESTYTGQVDWTILTDVNVAEMVVAGQEEMHNRGETGAFLPLVAKVPDRVDFLYGQSYLAAILFFVPRAVWPEKPRGVGPMTNAYIYHEEAMRPGEIIQGAGIPPGAMGEAYWNFYYPGVVMIYLLYGMFHWWLAALLRRNAAIPAVWVLYALTLLMNPTSSEIVGWLQSIIPGIAIMWWMGVLRRRPRMVLRHATA